MKTSYFSICSAVFRFGLAWLCVVPLKLVSQIAEYNYATGHVQGRNHVGGADRPGSGQVSRSYWNTQTSQQSASAGGEGRTTANMTYPHAANTFVDWDFSHVWQEDRSPAQNNGYPLLKASEVYLLSLRVDPPGAGTASGTGY